MGNPKMRFVKTLEDESEGIEEIGELKELLKDYSVKLTYLFGSRSCGEETKFSDIDIAVLFEEESDKRIDSLRADLIELLKEDAVDLIDLERAPPRLKYNVVKEGEALVGEDDSTEFEVKTMNEYFDFRPLERRYFEKMKERIESGEYGK